MKTKHLIPACMLLLSFGLNAISFAEDVKYRVDDIPKPLLKDAKAVVRNEEITVEIKNDSKVVQKVKYAITILNKNGKSDGYFMHMYDKNIKVNNIKAQMFDASGNPIKKKGGFEILDYAMIPDGTTYADYRVKAIDPEHFEYPYTVEYTYDVTMSEVINYPGWTPVDEFNIAVEKSSFTLVFPKQSICRYYEKNVISKAKIQTEADRTVYYWEVINLPAYASENFSPALEDFTPVVIIAPIKVKVEGYEGNFSTWEGFGLWINQLNEGKNNLSNETKVKIRKLTEGVTDDRAKIKKLYEYMQNKTRYVGIQVGIGGFQPFDAETVDRLSYGDCKALSNYMKSLLETVGIDSRYTLVQAGDDNPIIHTDFASNQFNHVVLCVPLAADTVWLECTSQQNPFNYMGTFTSDRKALVIDNQGGKLVNTPELKMELNLESRKTDVTLEPTGNGFADVITNYHGATYDNYGYILRSDQTDRKKLVTRRIHVPNFELDNFTINEVKNEQPFITERLNISFTSYSTKVGDKMMLCLNMMNKLDESPFHPALRKTSVSFKWPIYEVDTVIYTLPQGFTLEKNPARVTLQSDFGSYTTEVSKTGNSIQYVRTFQVFKGEHAVDRYDEIVSFFEKIVTADENKVILTRVM
jgi:hypothetical protein